jgi:diguanylate cyclase (GGDEF)-like protein
MGAATVTQDEDREIFANGRSLLNMQRPQMTQDGEVRWFDVSKLPLTDDAGTVAGVLGIVREITQHKRMEEELTRRANHDSLTGLPNRAFFHSQLSQAIVRAQRRRTGMALMYFDIDRFKQINDTHGHDVGDQVIRLFADRVCASLRASDFVARLGGDEFVLIVEDMAEPDIARHLAGKLLASMEEPLAIGEQALRITTSIGIATFDDTMTASQLIKAADDAMYEAKRAGRNCFRLLVR